MSTIARQVLEKPNVYLLAYKIQSIFPNEHKRHEHFYEVLTCAIFDDTGNEQTVKGLST